MTTLFKNLVKIYLLSLVLSAYADFDAGMAAYEDKDYKTAHQEWLPLAQQGELRAQSNIGLLYASGQGVEKDIDKAIYWFEKIADQGDAQGYFNLGMMYIKRNKDVQDMKQASKWIKKAYQTGSKKTSKRALRVWKKYDLNQY